MKIYVVRHGQTDWNFEGRIQGKTDIELNERGIEQANKVKELIKNCDINLIVSSPMKRAKRTAEIINEITKCDIIFDKALEERGYGIFEGEIREKLTDEIINSDFHIINNYYLNKDYKEIETIKSLCDRVWELLDNLKKNYNNKNILLVTHGGTTTAINGYFKGINEDGLIENPGLENCEIKVYEM